MSTALLIIHAVHWLTALLLFAVAGYGLKFRHRPTVLAISVFSALVGLWALCAAVTFSLPDLASRIIVNRIKMISPVLLAPSLLAIALAMRPKQSWHKYIGIVAFIIPFLSLCLLASPKHHELFIRDYRIFSIADMEFLAFSDGPWFMVHNLYTRIVLFLSVILLYRAGRDFTSKHRFRVRLIVVAVLVPLIGDTIAVHFVPVMRYLQITPLLLFFTAASLVYAIADKHLINVVPFARSKILDSLGDLYLVFNERQELVDFNARAEVVLSLSRKYIGLSQAEIIRHNIELEELLSLDMEDGENEWGASGRIYEVSRHALEEAGESCLGSVLSCKDITLRKKEEDSLREAKDIKTKILALIGHDFRGNLSASLIIAQNLAKNLKSIREEDIVSSCLNLEKITSQNVVLIEDLLDWSKYRLGMDHARDHIDLRQIVERTRDFLQPLADEHQVVVSIEISGREAIVIDKSAFRIVLRNLLTNAIKASPKISPIRVIASADDKELMLTVQDFGNGIEQDRIDDLFRLKKDKAAGIGLFLCKEFVTNLGGRIWVESEIGRGSRFFVSLPI